MNILFCSWNEVSPYAGGVERKITNLITSLNNQEDNYYSLYSNSVASDIYKPHIFKDTIQINIAEDNTLLITDFIKKNKIELCICLSEIRFLANVVTKLSTINGLVILTNHSATPGSECLPFPKFNIRDLFKLPRLYKHYYGYRSYLRHCYKTVYNLSDHIVVMSQKHAEAYLHFGKIKDNSKISVINNILSYDTYFDISEYNHKQKTVIIVARLVEHVKNISAALRIWEHIERQKDLSDWHLSIIGDGESYNMYDNYIKSHHLTRVTLEGTQDPLPYYKKASIYLMISPQESWGNVLTEAQQNACVPIAFDSLIAISEIIEDGYNGYVVPYNSLSVYRKKLLSLMSDNVKRKDMAINGLKSVHRFDRQIIIRQWAEIIKSLKRKANIQ